MDLFKKYKDIISGGQNLLSSIGNSINQAVPKIQQGIQNTENTLTSAISSVKTPNLPDYYVQRMSKIDPLVGLVNPTINTASGFVKGLLTNTVQHALTGTPEDKAGFASMDKAIRKGYGSLTPQEQTSMVDNSLGWVMGMTEAPKISPKNFVAEMEAFNKKFGLDATVQRDKSVTRILSDSQSLAEANTRGSLLFNDVKQKFADWVNQRKAAPIEGLLKGKDYQNLDANGLNGFFEIQAGNNQPKYNALRKYFDTKFNELKNAGVDMNYQSDYLPQLWNNTSEEIQQVFQRNLTQKPSFTIEKMIKDYQEGIAAGLTPKFNKVSDLVSWYDRTANKTLADTAYFKNLASESMILPKGKAPNDWVSLDSDRFPSFTSIVDGKKYSGVYKAPAELAGMINNYLRAPQVELLDKIANYSSSVKNKVLSFGVPGTAVNAHGFNILARNTLAASNPVVGAFTGFKYMLNPASAERDLAAIMKDAPSAVKNGLTFSIEDHAVLTDAPKGLKSKIGAVWNDLFEKPLFDKMLPALKLKYYNDLVESGLDGKTAAHTANTMFGGFNWEELGKSRDVQNIKRALILAPDWASTNIDIPKNIIKSVLNPKSAEFAPYRKFAANLLGTYVLFNMINKVSSGHYMFQNDPGHTFEIEAGYTPDGQKRYFRTYGTAVDFVRVPFDVANSLAKGNLQSVYKVITNRLSIPAAVAVRTQTDTDYTNKPIGWKGVDNFGNEMPLGQRIAGIGGEVSQLVGFPSFGKQALDTVSGKQGIEQGITQGFELPFRYSGGAYSTVQKQAKDLTGLSGKELYDQNQSLKGQTKFSDNQVNYIRSGDPQQNMKDVLLQREINSKTRRGESVPQDLLDQLSNPTNVSAAETSPQDEQLLKIAKQKVSSTGQEQKVGDTLIYKTSTGSVKTIPDVSKYYMWKDSETGDYEKVAKTVDLKTPQISGNDLIDIPNFSTLSSRIGTRKKDVIKLYNAGLIGSAEATREINKFDAAQGLVKEIIKNLKAKSTVKAGTVSKAKVAKLRTLTKPLPRIKVSKPKSVKTVKLPSAKRISLTPPKAKKLTPRRISIK